MFLSSVQMLALKGSCGQQQPPDPGPDSTPPTSHSAC